MELWNMIKTIDYQNTKDYISTATNYLKDKLQKTKQFVNTNILNRPYIIKAAQIVKLVTEKTIQYGKKHAPLIYSKISSFLSNNLKYTSLLKYPFSYCYDKFKYTKYGNKIDSILKQVKKIIYPPIKWIIKIILKYLLCPIYSYLIDKFKNTNFYKKYFKGIVDSYYRLKIESKHLQAKNIIKNSYYGQLLKKQNHLNGLKSEDLLGSYLNKFGGNQKAIQKIKNKLVIVNDLTLQNNSNDKQFKNQQQNNKKCILNYLVGLNKIEITSLSFDAAAARGKSYTIQGKMKLKNETDQKLCFEIISGQMFGCSIPKTSQHTVVRGLKQSLQPNQNKQIILEAFCGDSSLSWPYGDNNFKLTNFAVRDFNNEIEQNSLWNYLS